jgi:hypothetical protein
MSRRKSRRWTDGGTYIACFRASTESGLAPLTIARHALDGRIRFLRTPQGVLFHRDDVLAIRHLAKPMEEVAS